jgi:small basic protein
MTVEELFCPVCGSSLGGRFCSSCGADSAGPPTTAASVTPVVPTSNRLLTVGIREGLRERLGFSLVAVLAAVAGLLMALALGTVVIRGGNQSLWAIVVVGVILMGLGLACSLVLRLMARPRNPEVVKKFMPFATILAVAGVLLVVAGRVAITLQDTYSVNQYDQGSATLSTSLAWWPYLLGAALFLALWIVPGLQGRPFLLGAGLTTFASAVTGFVYVRTNDFTIRYATSGESTPNPLAFGSQTIFRSAFWVALALGVAFLVVAVMFDWLGWRGLATPFVVAGILTGGNGAIGKLTEGSIPSIMLGTSFVVVVILVGVLGGRRATTWLGGLALGPAIVVLVVKLLGSHPDHVSAGLLFGAAALFVALAAGVAFLLGPKVRSRYSAIASARRA